AVPADSERVPMGSRGYRWGLLVRLLVLGGADALCWLADRPPRPTGGCRNPGGGAGRPPAAGVTDPPALRSLSKPWRVGRRRGQSPRLHRTIAVPDQLVCATARAGAQHRLFRCRRRLDYDPAVAAGRDRRQRLARRLPEARSPRPRGAVAA